MGNRSSGINGWGWRAPVRKRKRRNRKRRNAANAQKRHLKAVKTAKELRAILLGSRHLKKAGRP